MSTTEDRDEMQVYEIGYSVLPSIPEDNLPRVVSTIQEIIKKHGAAELDSEMPEKMDLAYSMSKTIGARKYIVNDAYVGWMKLECEPAAVEAIKSDLDKVEEVLRFLLIKAPRESAFTFASAKQVVEESAPAEPTEAPKDSPAETVVE